jgi:hypothetical protein
MATSSAGPSEGSEPLYASSTLYQTALAGTSEAHDRLVYDFGVPFRLGHRLLGAMVRAHYNGDQLPDLNALLRAETGTDFSIDQSEIMDIVLGRVLWPTTIDETGLRKVWDEMDGKARAAEQAFAGEGAVHRAFESLLRDARSFCA